MLRDLARGALLNNVLVCTFRACAARYNVDKEAARVALDALMEDKAFRAAVVEEVSRVWLGSFDLRSQRNWS